MSGPLQPFLKVHVRAMDLRYVNNTLLVGHYEQDVISGAEAIVDRDVVRGALSVRRELGLYAGPVGTVTVVLRQRSSLDHARGNRSGVVVTGLGPFDGSLGSGTLTEAVRAGVLRYLLQIYDSENSEEGTGEERLSALLLGYDSSANLTVADSVTALVRGVVEANRKFADSTMSSLRIAELEIVELYLNTAIAAGHALCELAATMNEDPRQECRIEAADCIEQGEGVRLRLEESRSGSHWERIVVTAAERSLPGAPDDVELPGPTGEPVSPDAEASALTPVAAQPPAPRARPAVAERLRFLYLGKRARAETIIQQRQPGLVETLVSQQLRVRTCQPDFSRTLFQLLVPADFKEPARRIERVVLVVDGYTANLPWELLMADDVPLAVRMALVRQLSSTRFRSRPRQALENRAYVIGNPSTEGFSAAFLKRKDPPPLPSAQTEAEAVSALITELLPGVNVEEAIGVDQSAADVVTRLYRHPYRFVHIAAHGIFEERHADGSLRTGVVLSGGLMITAAEIAAMEVVPELVFLNCCYLGEINPEPTAFNRLACSVSRELIEVGVRAVVAAGWAVDDEPARLFAETFYRALLKNGRPFGEAVFDARRLVWEKFPSTVTWGAYQAYGDPSWRPNQAPREAEDQQVSWKPVAPEELIARLERIHLDLVRSSSVLSAEESRRHEDDVQQLLQSVPPVWLERPGVCAALGNLWGSLGDVYVERAITQYRRALESQSSDSRLPLDVITRLAELETVEGELRRSPELVQRGIGRLLALHDAAAAGGSASGDGPRESQPSLVLCDAYLRLAGVWAADFLQSLAASSKASMEAALAESLRWCTSDSANELSPLSVNRAFLSSLLPGGSLPDASAPTEQSSAAPARALLSADAMLAHALQRGMLAADSAGPVLVEIEAGYARAFEESPAAVRTMAAARVCRLSLLHKAFGAVGSEAHAVNANALALLAERLVPGACNARSS